MLGRMAELESHATGTEARLRNVENTLIDHGRKLDAIAQAVTASASRPVFDPGRIVSFVKDTTMVIAAVAASIIYIATNIADKPVALLDQRVTQLEHVERGEHVTTVRKTGIVRQ